MPVMCVSVHHLESSSMYIGFQPERQLVKQCLFVSNSVETPEKRLIIKVTMPKYGPIVKEAFKRFWDDFAGTKVEEKG
eukprot:1365387-Amorphochlora_amoeboformis.AAC.1